MASVKFDHIFKSFGKVPALNDFDLHIEDGSFLVLLGPSGCGKTTALRLLSGLDNPTSGNIYINDKLMNNISPRHRNIAMVFQSYALYPHMSVFDNIAFPLRMQKNPEKEINQRVRDTTHMLEIFDFLSRRPRDLSGGQRQRVALARAIIRKPSVFLLDEPLSNLDAILRTHTRFELKQLHQRFGTTFIYVTHDQVEAMSMATRIAIMDKGVIQQTASPREIYTRPRNTFVAGFIGNPPMNFLNVRVSGSSNQIRLSNDSFSLPVPDEMRQALLSFSGKEVILGIRPEDIRIQDWDDSSTGIPGTIQIEELMGNESILHLQIGDESILIRVPCNRIFRPGYKVCVVFDTNRLCCFHPESGLAIS